MQRRSLVCVLAAAVFLGTASQTVQCLSEETEDSPDLKALLREVEALKSAVLRLEIRVAELEARETDPVVGARNVLRLDVFPIQWNPQVVPAPPPPFPLQNYDTGLYVFPWQDMSPYLAAPPSKDACE